MEIFEVVGSLRAELLALKLKTKELEVAYSLLERFTWNMVKMLNTCTTCSALVLEYPSSDKKGSTDGNPSIDDPTLF